MSTPIAIVAALAAALVLGIGTVVDRRSTKKVDTRKAGEPGLIRDLIHQPLWLIAIALNLAGWLLQVTALKFGSLALVEPLLVCQLIFAVLISRMVGWKKYGPPGARQWDPGMLAGVAATTAGIAGFLAIGRPSAGTTHVGIGVLPVLAIGLAVVVGGCLAVAKRSTNLGPPALALACGASFGVSAFAIKLVTAKFGGGFAAVFSDWPIYVVAVAGPMGFVLHQHALQQGTFLARVQAIITTTDPILSIGLSMLWLDVRLRGGAAAITGEVVSLLVMVTGVVVVARHSPHASQEAAATKTVEQAAAR
jgi:hypothetical protein